MPAALLVIEPLVDCLTVRSAGRARHKSCSRAGNLSPPALLRSALELSCEMKAAVRRAGSRSGIGTWLIRQEA